MSKVLLVSYMILGLLLLSLAQAADPKIGIYELKRGDFQLKLTNYGATIMSVMVPDKNGPSHHLVLI